MTSIRVDSQDSVQMENNQSNVIALRIVNQDGLKECPFWISLFKPGKIPARELNTEPDIGTIFSKAIDLGIDEEEPIMLSNVNIDPPRFIYLLPKYAHKKIILEKASPNLITTVRAWNVDRLGFYWVPELIDEKIDPNIVDTLTEFIDAGVGREYYLYSGKKGVNYVLNQALALKDKLDSSTLRILVYHV